MFNEINEVYKTWVSGQILTLADIQLVMASVDRERSTRMERFISCLDRLDVYIRDSLLRDPMFCRWVKDLTSTTIAVYSGAAEEEGHDFASILTQMELTLAAITRTELEFDVTTAWPQTVLLPVTGLLLERPASWRARSTRCRYDPDICRVSGSDVAVQLSRLPSSSFIKLVDRHFDLFNDPTDMEYSIEFDDTVDTAHWISDIDAAARLVQTDQVAAELVHSFVGYVVPLRKKAPLTNLSFSVKSLPGVVFKSHEVTPYSIGETLVHEGDHQFFYAVETVGDFWMTASEAEEPRFYSPWRDDKRPLDGILRGLSAFTRVTRYYSQFMTRLQLSDADQEVAGTILVRRLRESEIALGVISEQNQLSEFGIRYVAQVAETLRDSDQAARAMVGYERWNGLAIGMCQQRRDEWIARHSHG